MKINANISISRSSNNVMNLRVQDEASNITFLELEFGLADFMQVLTGLAYVDAKKAEVRGLEFVGKEKVTQPRQCVYTGKRDAKRQEKEQWLRQEKSEEGWIVDSYLGSQSSVFYIEDKEILNYRVYRYEAQNKQADA